MGKRKSSYKVLKNNKKSKSMRKKYIENHGAALMDCHDSNDDNVFENKVVNNIEFISSEEIKEIQDHELCIEKVQPEGTTVSGNRIVNLNFIFDWALTLQSDHSKICTGGKLFLDNDDCRGLGLVRKLTFKCSQCDKQITKYTENPDQKSQINTGAVWGTLTSGSSYGQLSDLCAAIDIPPMTFHHFQKIENELGETWKDCLAKDIEAAGIEEKEAAIRKGQIDDDGVPFTTVYCDGGWSKRSYGHSYNASSGIAVIIGKESKKVLFVGVRNKYCMICTRAANNKTLPREHLCFKNWTKSSSAMESDIIVEGFNQSITLHGLRYKRFIADGDSSVFYKIRENVSYGRYVIKTECSNHVIKNYGKALYKIKKDTKISISGRKLLTQNKIVDLQTDVQKSIYKNCDQDVENLKSDLSLNIANVFGESATNLKNTGIYQHMNFALEQLIKKSHKIIHNETNNCSELFMALVAKFNAGKRLNLTSRGGFQTRAYLSALQFNRSHSWQLKSYSTLMKRPVGQNLQRRILKKERSLKYERKQKQKATQKNEENYDYGPQATQPEPSAEEMISEKQRLLVRVQLTLIEISDLERSTVGQFGNPKYEAERQDRLTSSYFGRIIKRRPTTTSNSLAKSIVNPSNSVFLSTATEYGKRNEKVAIQLLEGLIDSVVKPAGLFVDVEFGYLAASPDGLVGEDGIVEVKCLYNVSQSGLSLDEAYLQNKTLCLHFVDGKRQLKRNHNYFYQIQGQLNITRRKYCYFVVYRGYKEDFHVEIIEKDQNLWQNMMLPKLKKFYMEEIMPEIIFPKGSTSK